MKRVLLGLFLFAALEGCSSDAGEVRLGVSVAAIDTAVSAANDDARSAAGLEVTRVRILVNTAKVGYAGHSDGDETAVGPTVVELTGDEIKAGAQRSFSLGQLASGTYGGAEIEIDNLDADADTSDASLADFASSGASVIIDGTYNDAAFQFAGHFLAEQGTDGEVQIDTSTPFELAMTVDPSSWFVDASGAVLDPTDTSQHDAISLAICKSLDTQPQQSGGRGKGGGPKAHCVESAK